MLSIDGILLLDKPSGCSSNRALQRAKRLFEAKKAGHTGSLDPLATGMLPICFGEATKFSQYLLDANKAYDVVAILGATSHTGDAEGEVVVHTEQPNITLKEVHAVLPRFQGEIEQIPPMFSALKHQGKPLYVYARRGEMIPRASRAVMIYHLACQALIDSELHLSVICSKGTYIRTLVERIGEALGVGAYVKLLHRTYTAGFENQPMWTLDHLESEDLETRKTHLLPLDYTLHHLPQITVDEVTQLALYHGQMIQGFHGLPPEGIVRLYTHTNQFLGLGQVVDNLLIAKRLLKNTL